MLFYTCLNYVEGLFYGVNINFSSMQPYNSISGKSSGVTGYEIGIDFISLQFINGESYVYSYASAGKANIETMKSLALANKGLSTYISQNKPGYERKY
jgi:hypothetical protein